MKKKNVVKKKTTKKKVVKKVAKKKVVKKDTEKELELKDYPGLEQKIGARALHKIITKDDVWQTKGRQQLTIITHNGVKKIADYAKVQKDVEYIVLTQPTAYNNYQYTIQAKVCRKKECVTELGEANRNNLGTKGRNNPANMAQKRAYDRAVFRLLGITGILGEDELPAEEKEENMDKLSHDERKEVAPLINQILLAKKKDDMIKFNRDMKQGAASKLNDNQLVYMRELYKKKLAELSSVSF